MIYWITYGLFILFTVGLGIYAFNRQKKLVKELKVGDYITTNGNKGIIKEIKGDTAVVEVTVPIMTVTKRK